MVAKSIRFELIELNSLNSDEFRIDSIFDKKMRPLFFVKNEKKEENCEKVVSCDEL